MKSHRRTTIAPTAAIIASLVTSTAAFAEVPRKPTFTKDVAPIVFENCANCHRPGSVAPMSLLTYDEVRPWAKSIGKQVEEKLMPPWHAVEGIAEFENDRSLSADEIETVARWVKQGARQGDVADMPPLPDFPGEGWQLGEPDLVVTFDQVDLAAGGPDQFYDLVQTTPFDEDKWITAVEVLPSNKKVAHHVIVYQQTPDEPSGMAGWIGAWAAGTDPMVFREGTGRVLKAGASLVADMHYHPAETPESDQTQIGLHFAGSELEKEVVNLWIVNGTFEIPAGAPNHGARVSFTFPQDSYILSYLPHMHYRGKDFTYKAFYPDGNKEILMAVDDYDFGWQTQYQLAEPKFIPKGTRIDCTAHWDNSAGNPRNPDPTITVRNGDESYDEMMIGFVDYIVAEGVRPRSADEIIAEQAQDFASQHLDEVFLLTIDAGQQIIPGYANLPQSGTGTWMISLMGAMYECPIQTISWNGNDVEGEVLVPVEGMFAFRGSVDPATGELTGAIWPIDNNDDSEARLFGKKL